MNDSITWVTPARPRGGHSPNPDSYMAVGSRVTKNSKSGYQVCIKVFEPAMKDLRWFAGDRIDVGFDDSFLYLRRSNHGNYKLCATAAADRKASEGRPVNSQIRFSQQDDFPFKAVDLVYLTKDDVAVSEDGIVSFIYPKQGAK